MAYRNPWTNPGSGILSGAIPAADPSQYDPEFVPAYMAPGEAASPPGVSISTPSNPSLLDLMGALAWAPPNLPLFRGAPTAADGSASAAPPANGAMQAAAAFGPRPGTSPAVMPVSDIQFDYRARPTAPAVPFMDANPFFERPQDQPLYPYTQQFPPGPDRLPNQANPPALPPAPPAAAQPAASVLLPRPRPPEASLTPMYPVPKTPAKPKPYFDPTTAPPPLMVPSDGWRLPNLEDDWLSPSRSNVPMQPSPPLVGRGSILQRSGINVPDLVDAIISAESGGDTYARSISSSALGAGQITGGTWLGDLKRNQADVVRADPWLDASVRENPNSLTLHQARDAGLMDMRTNYDVSWRATERLAEENAASLMRAHLPLTPGNLYLAHFLGSDQATAVLRADPNTPAEQVVSRAAALANQSLIKGRTVGQVMSEINARVAWPRRLPFR